MSGGGIRRVRVVPYFLACPPLALTQLWEVSAAKHVSLAPQLAAAAALATRWRRAELRSWPHLLDKVKLHPSFCTHVAVIPGIILG